MNMILFLASIFLPAVAGYVLLRGEEEFSGIEKLVYSFAIGTGLLSFYLYGLMLINVAFRYLSLLPFFLTFIAIGIMQRRRRSKSHRIIFSDADALHMSTGWKIMLLLLAALMAWKLFFMTTMIMTGPTMFWDAYGNWNYTAKIIFYANRPDMSAQGEDILRNFSPRYPLHIQLIRAWTAFVMGKWDDSYVNLHSLVLFLCLIGALFEFLKKKAGVVIAAAFTYILSVNPILGYNVVSGYADMAVGFFFMAAILLLYYWHATRKRAMLFLSGLLVAIAMFTKNEGTAIVFPSVLITLIFLLMYPRYHGKQALMNIGLFLVPLLPASLWLQKSGAIDSMVSMSGARESGIIFHPEGLGPFLQHIFVFESHNIFWAGASVLIFAKAKYALRPDVRVFLIPSLLSFCATIFVFFFTPNIEFLINGMTINRTLLITIPLLTLTCGILYAQKQSGQQT